MDLIEKSNQRWVNCKPDAHLTWGKFISGDNFVDKIIELNGFIKPYCKILEIGPGYGRIFNSIVKKEIPFQSYSVIDISEKVIFSMRSKNIFENAFLGNFEEFNFGSLKFDLIISSLTLMHFYPDISKALLKMRRILTNTGSVIFDLVEGRDSGHFEEAGNFIKPYTKDEIEKIARNTGFNNVIFDYVVHDTQFTLLLAKLS